MLNEKARDFRASLIKPGLTYRELCNMSPEDSDNLVKQVTGKEVTNLKGPAMNYGLPRLITTEEIQARIDKVLDR